ncbi:hypothetical protein [Streptomyces xiaopingdaonensis]|uniref:hypothetical protein n=1 Tax=Streptomyces xiaopingdaonensis TaxID=1565415 RepID=UPI00037E5C39|nr:hypothetical protein [Streptomyces xiaopingdaonensis]
MRTRRLEDVDVVGEYGATGEGVEVGAGETYWRMPERTALSGLCAAVRHHGNHAAP